MWQFLGVIIMGGIYKRGRMWHLDYSVMGRRVRRTAGPSKKIAELALEDAEVKAAKGEYGFARKDIAIDKFFEKFHDYTRAIGGRGSSPLLIGTYCYDSETDAGCTIIEPAVPPPLLRRDDIHQEIIVPVHRAVWARIHIPHKRSGHDRVHRIVGGENG